MQQLLDLNDPPYGTEGSFNGLRVAHALAKHDAESRLLLCGTCMDTRRDHRGRCATMTALTGATIAADKVLPA